jgi:hypothetical protein
MDFILFANVEMWLAYFLSFFGVKIMQKRQPTDKRE